MLLYTCQKDDTVVDSVQSDGQQFKIEILNENNLRENNSLSAKITQIKRSFESKQGSNSSARERFGFHVNTDSIKYIEELGTGKHSYNFPMSADSLGRVRNFVLASQGNGQYDSHVVTYGFTESEYSTLDEQALSERYTSFSRSMDIDSLIQEDPSYLEKVLAPGYQCAEFWMLVTIPNPPCEGNLCGHSHGGEATTISVWVLVASECWPTGGGSTGNGEGPGPGDNGGSHGNTNPHPGAPGNNVVTPTFCRGCPEIDVEGEEEECPNSLELASMINGLSLTPQQASFLMGNCDLAQPAYDYWSNGGDDDFTVQGIQAEMEGGEVDFDELFIETPTPDDDYSYQGDKMEIPNPLILDNGDEISIDFGTTASDNQSANQEVSIDLISALKFAVEHANESLEEDEQIESLYIMATTNGSHSATSNHSNGTAMDISRINGVKMIVSGVTNQIKELQIAFDAYIFIRENFGPHFKHKFFNSNGTWNYNYPVGGHNDHIHVSVRR